MRRLLAALLAASLALTPAADAHRRHHRHHRQQQCDNGTGGVAPFQYDSGGVAPPPRCG
jgi:hypothetical protein